MPGYSSVFPENSNVQNLAFHFLGDYDCASYRNRNIIRRIFKDIEKWQTQWQTGKIPILTIKQIGDYFMLVDTRDVSKISGVRILAENELKMLLAPKKYPKQNEVLGWAIVNRLGVMVGDEFVPFVTADGRLFAELNE